MCEADDDIEVCEDGGEVFEYGTVRGCNVDDFLNEAGLCTVVVLGVLIEVAAEGREFVGGEVNTVFLG